MKGFKTLHKLGFSFCLKSHEARILQVYLVNSNYGLQDLNKTRWSLKSRLINKLYCSFTFHEKFIQCKIILTYLLRL